MREPRMKDKMGLFLGLGILILCMLCAPACATYSYNGSSLETIKSGTVNGDVYVSYGDKAGLNTTAWNYTLNTLVTNFTNVPNGDDIEWAELKFGVWGGSTVREGFANATLSNGSSTETFENVSLRINSPDPVQGAGSAMWLVNYTCTDELKSLSNGNPIKATINAWPDISQGDNKRLDSRIYGAVLIVVYKDGSKWTQYWINQNLLNLHKEASNVNIGGTLYNFTDLDADRTYFNGPVNETLSNASLTVGYFAGDPNQKDYLYLNALPITGSPYYLTDPGWDIEGFEDNLVGIDVANSTEGTKTNFDLKTFDVNNIDLLSPDNYAIFWRGHDSVNETIWDPAWPGVNNETESYYTPFLAVLKIKS
jgi:hypothetical protein